MSAKNAAGLASSRTPAPTHGTFLPVQLDKRHGFTGLAQAYDNKSRAAMIEDQLTRDERIRLEALAQAVQRYTMKACSSDEICAVAGRFERWIREGQ